MAGAKQFVAQKGIYGAMPANKSILLFEEARIILEDAAAKLELLVTTSEEFEDAKTQLENATSSLKTGSRTLYAASLEEENDAAPVGVCQLRSEIPELRKRICEPENDKLKSKTASGQSKVQIRCLEKKNSEQKITNKQRPIGELKDIRVEYGNPRVFLDIAIHGLPAGHIVMELFADTTPLLAENFRALCTGEKGISRKGRSLHYKGSSFYFISLGFVAGGNINGDKSGSGESICGTSMPAENFIRKHTGLGDLTMIGNWRNKGTTHGSSFFISTTKNSRDDEENVVIGKMVDDMVVLNAIVSAFPGQVNDLFSN